MIHAKVDEIEHSIAISLRKVIEAQSYRTANNYMKYVLVKMFLFCVGNFRDIFVYYQGYRIFRIFN